MWYIYCRIKADIKGLINLAILFWVILANCIIMYTVGFKRRLTISADKWELKSLLIVTSKKDDSYILESTDKLMHIFETQEK